MDQVVVEQVVQEAQLESTGEAVLRIQMVMVEMDCKISIADPLDLLM